MSFNLEKFKADYGKWVEKHLADFEAGKVDKAVKEYPLLVKFPRGSMMGEPDNTQRQRRIILDAFEALKTMTEPGAIQELPYRWKKPDPPAQH